MQQDHAPILRNAKIMLGDQDISSCVTGFSLTMNVHEVSKVVLELHPGQVEIDLTALLELIDNLTEIKEEMTGPARMKDDSPATPQVSYPPFDPSA